jgi:tetratricopeptide (TPR) repeat protein
VRITVQLVAARPERHLWTNTYDRQLRDVLALHSEVAQAVAREIRTSLTPEQQGRLAASRPVNPAAHEEYLRGRRYFDKPAPGGLQEAIAHFNKAIELDPSFAPAYSSLAMLKLWSSVLLANRPPRAVASEARVAAARALELDPGCAEAIAVEGTLNLYFDWDWVMAERRLKRALELNPSDGTLYHPYADYLLVLGRPEESLEYTKRGAALDPLSGMSNAFVGGHLIYARHAAEAVSFLRQQIELNPDMRVLQTILASGLWQQGDGQAAIAQYRVAWGGDALYGLLERGYAEAGARGAARAVARELEARSKRAWVNPLNIASWYARAGDAEATIQWLEKAYDELMPFLLHLRGDAEYDFVRADPRFVQLLKKIGFPE